jgi:hypothetical protein
MACVVSLTAEAANSWVTPVCCALVPPAGALKSPVLAVIPALPVSASALTVAFDAI